MAVLTSNDIERIRFSVNQSSDGDKRQFPKKVREVDKVVQFQIFYDESSCISAYEP